MVRDLSKDNELILEARNLTKQFKVPKNNTLTACDNINLSIKGKLWELLENLAVENLLF